MDQAVTTMNTWPSNCDAFAKTLSLTSANSTARKSDPVTSGAETRLFLYLQHTLLASDLKKIEIYLHILIKQPNIKCNENPLISFQLLHA